MKTISFKKKLLASAIGSCAVAGFSGTAIAQDNQPMVAEEVVVTGIRASLERAMDIKRDSQGVVDAISAEDIGKFPDTNLAESLQRITGVSIDRTNGEGAKVTVRGLGPEYNLVTLNGRQLPGATIEGTAASGSRSFDFSNIAAEGVSGVEVYKTVRAENAPGGIGATINIKTARPFDNPGLRASLGVKGVYDTSAEDATVTPEVSGLYSQTFADDKFGVAISASYQEREAGIAQATTGAGWHSHPGTTNLDWGAGTGGWGAIADNDQQVNRPEANDVYSVPQQVNYRFSDFERKRLNGQVVFQFAPIDSIEATLDYTYSRNDMTTTFNDMGAWFNFGGQSSVWTEGPEGGSVETPLIYSEVNSQNADTGQWGDLTFGAGEMSQLNENKSLGFNLAWQATEKLSLEVDYHDSTAEAGPDNAYGNDNVITASAYVRTRTTADFNGDMPVLILETINDESGEPLRVEDLRLSGSAFRASHMKHDIQQLQFKGKYEFDEGDSISFGLEQNEQKNHSYYSVVQRDTWGGLAQGDSAILDPVNQLPSEFFTLENFAGEFDASGGSHPDLFSQRWVYDFHDLVGYAADTYGVAGPGDCGTYYCTKSEPDVENIVDEKSQSAYVQLSVETELGDMATRVNAGLRYEDTEVVAPAINQQFGPGIDWVAANEFRLNTTSEPVETTDSGSYDYLLPSIDVSVDVLEDVVVRASYGRSLARPQWNQLKGGLTLATNPRANGGTGSRGNPGLLPMVSDNYDISTEWYYGDASYVSVGYYQKDVTNFIGTRVVTEYPLADAYHPAMGARFQAAVDSGIDPSDNVAIRNWIIENTPEGDPGVSYPEGQDPVIHGLAGEDPASPFEITETINENDVKYTGWEIALQHTFGDSGFGGIANYTIVNSNVSYDNMLTNAPQFAVTGQSDSANLVAFYDKHGIQVRIAYNWRDGFLTSTTSGTGNNPIYVDAYDQIDINASYELTDQLSLFVEGINVTDEYVRQHGRDERQVLGVYQTGARYNIGARYTF